MQLQELKHRASGNIDESFVNPGISEKQPLHVTMVSFSYISHLVRYILSVDFHWFKMVPYILSS